VKPAPEVFRGAPNAALPPAKENGVLATAVPKTLVAFGAPKAANSVTTLRGGDEGDVGDDGVAAAVATGFLGETGVRAGNDGAYG
jgi:hypothetical protein